MPEDYQEIGDTSQLQEQPSAASVKIDLSQITSVKKMKKPNEGGGWDEEKFPQNQKKEQQETEEDEEIDDNDQEDLDEDQEDTEEETEVEEDDDGSDDSEESDDEEESDEDEESDQESDDSDEDEEEDESDEEEVGDEEGDDSEEDEGNDDLDDEEQTSENEEFNVYAETDGVFETIEDLKKTSKLLKDNPELQGMLDYFDEHGTLLPYLQATMVDVSTMTDLEILEGKFRDEYGQHFGNLTDAQIQAMFKKKVLSKYNLDSEDEADKELGMAEMTMDANRVRAEIKDEQQHLLLPKDRDDEAQRKQKEADQKEALNALKNKLSYQIRKEIKDGKLKVRVNDKTNATLKVSPKRITSLLDKTSDLSLFTDKNGKFDLQKMAILVDTEGFMSQVQSNMKTEGKQELVREKLKKRPKKDKSPEGKGKPKPTKKLDPTDLRSFKGVKVKTVSPRRN